MTPLAYYPIPEWINLAFLILIPLPFILISRLVWKASQQIAQPMLWFGVPVFFILYLAYLYTASVLGWFHVVSFPPRVLLLSTFPYAFLLFGWVQHLKATRQLIESTLAEDWIRLHLFRVVGGFFILLAVHDALPRPFAFIAGFGDVLTALSSLFVARALEQKKTYAPRLAMAWNLFGTVDILFTAIAANVLTRLSIDTGSMGVDSLAYFPFCIIPAFAPPTILFLHWVIFKKIRSLR